MSELPETTPEIGSYCNITLHDGVVLRAIWDGVSWMADVEESSEDWVIDAQMVFSWELNS